ncbi:xyloglucan-specific galacturonosyltransferase 1-like [Silene latifolia]|uniref:xyloglucan-specific galacturonosyltransferase 1-like n=1 Tax=Silene latifolia TaxID=37657 RepID=UPI003D77CFC6
MAIPMRSKKSKITKKTVNKENSIFDSSKILAFSLLAVLIIFIWSSSTSILSDTTVRICATSRKFNLFCEIPLPVINVIQKESHFPPSASQSAPSNNKEMVNARKEVERQVSVLRSYIAKSKALNALNCDGRGIYVYDLPTKFNKDLLAKCKEITWLDFCKYLSNDGIGEPLLELGNGWYNTHQYSLEPIFHSRVLNHPCRVKTAEEANLFYVPFYGGLDVLRWHFKNVSNDLKDALSHELVDWLKSQSSWRRNFGLDHVLVLGKITWDFRRSGNGTWGTGLLGLDGLDRVFKLLIERHPWEINEVGVPHPTHFHPRSDKEILDLQAQLRRTHRVNFISFAGASRNSSESIRSRIIDQCTSTPDKCTFLDCENQACFSPVPVIKLFMKSEFCLQPAGDSPTRKSLFDSLVAGCIPVLFNPLTAYYQYAWHLPEDYRKYSVYIDQDDIRSSKVNVVEVLVKIPLKEREKMRKYIIFELMPRLVYADPRAKLEIFEDAFSIAMNNLLERSRISRLH